MSVRVAFSSSVSKVLRSIPAAANASSVGAKTVNGPSPCKALTRSACERAATRESCTPVLWAFVGMSSFSSATTTGETNRLAITSMAIVALLLLITPAIDECLIKRCFITLQA